MPSSLPPDSSYFSQQSARYLDPTGFAVVGPGALSPLRVVLEKDLRGFLVRSFRIDREGAIPAQSLVPDTLPRGDIAGQAIQLADPPSAAIYLSRIALAGTAPGSALMTSSLSLFGVLYKSSSAIVVDGTSRA